MQVHAIDRHAVDPGFGIAEARKEIFGALLSRRTQCRAVDQPRDVAQAAVYVIVAVPGRATVRHRLLMAGVVTSGFSRTWMKRPIMVVGVTAIVFVMLTCIVMMRGVVPVMIVVRMRVVVIVAVPGVIASLRVGLLQRLLVFPADTEFCTVDAGTKDALGPHRLGVDRQTAEGPPHIVERHPGVDQGTEDHVAGGTGEAVEVDDSQSRPSYRVRTATQVCGRRSPDRTCSRPDSTIE